MNIIIAGDFCDRCRTSSLIAEGNFGIIFDEVKKYIEKADFSIVNFEFPIVLNEEKPIKKCGPNLKGQAKSIEALRYAGFNVCTLANNHILDQGEQCCNDTKKKLEESFIKTVGAGRNLSEAEEILYLKKNGEIVAVINCCEHEFSIATETTTGANPLNPIKQFYKIQEARKNANYVIIIIHGGHEHFQLPSLRMVDTYRFFIDAGADAVVNHHQHCFSGYEIYHEKPIFYGIGNFCFDKFPILNKSLWNYGYMVELIFGDNVDFHIIPYHQCGENPVIEKLNNNAFDEKLKYLNTIIKNKELLEKKIEEFYLRSENDINLYVEPYSGRLFSKLYNLGLLPHFISGQKASIVLNHVDCESHREKLLFTLKRKI